MIEKKSVNFVRLPAFWFAILFVAFAGRVDAQSTPNGPVQQSLRMEYLSAENAKRTLLQQLPPEVAELVIVQVNSATNEIHLVGLKNAVVLAVQTLQEMDRPNASPPYLNTAAPPNPLRQNTQPSLARDDFASARPYGADGDGFQRNAPQNVHNTASPSNLSFREPVQGANFNPSYNLSDIATVEGYEPGTYFCKPSHLNRMSHELQSRYGYDRNIRLETIPESGKILVWAPQRVQREITALMTQAGAWAEVPAGRDHREYEGTLLRFASEPRPPVTQHQPVVERTHSPNNVTLEQIEAKLQGLFGNRMTVLTEPDVQSKKYRVAIPQRPQGMIVCEVMLDYPRYQINITAPQNVAVEMSRLVQAIDQTSPEDGRDRRFIAIQNSDVEQIRKLLDVYRSKPIPDSSRRFRNTPNMLAYQRNGNATRHPIQQVNYQDEGGFGAGFGFGQGQTSGDELGGIIFDPTSTLKIQVIPELEVVIIDAPMEEVRRIMEMIKEIEELSKLAESKIEVMFLKYVHCEALDTLLRTELRTSYNPMTGQIQTIHLYTEMFATKPGRVWVLPLHNPNAMLIVGWGHARDAMKTLIEHLDQPVESENSLIRVIPLEFAPVEQVATVLNEFFNPLQLGPGMANAGFYPKIRVLSDPRTNTLIVQAAPNDYRDILRIIAEVDVDKGKIKLQVKTFKMKNLLAVDMAAALEGALLTAINGTADNRIPVIELILGEGAGRKIIESGFLTEVTIEPVPANNTVAVTAPGSCMPLIEELIDMIDQSPGVALVKVIPIKYSDATTIQGTLTRVFPTQAPGTTSVSLPGAEGGEIFIPIRFGTDTRSNSILVAGAESDIMFIEMLIRSLDKPDALQRKLTTYRLRNSSAADVSVAITNYLEKRTTLQEDEVISAYQKLQDAVIVEAEPISNILIISASDENLKEIEALIKELDEESPQVVVQVLIAEVTLGKADEFGIELGLQDRYLFNRSTAATGGYYNFNDPAIGLGNNSNDPLSLATSGTVATQLLSNFGTGRVNTDSGFGGMIFSASSDAVSVLIRAMQERSRVEVLSRPQITAQDNQLALIFIGQNVVRVGAGGYDNSYGILTSRNTPEDVGLFLGVIPRISKGASPNEPDKITMLISASKSSLGGANDGQQMVVNNTIVRSPNVNKTRMETIVSALDGETVMLGGLLNTDKQEISRRVPFLSNIPIAGNLFKYEYQKQKRTELIMIMRPRIVRKSEDMEAIKRVEFARMNWTLADVTKLHGDIGVYNPMSRQPVTGGAPSFAPNAVDMSQLRDLPMPQQIHSNDAYRPPQSIPTNTLPNTSPNTLQNTFPGGLFEPTAQQPSSLQLPSRYDVAPSTQLAPVLPEFTTVPPDASRR